MYKQIHGEYEMPKPTQLNWEDFRTRKGTADKLWEQLKLLTVHHKEAQEGQEKELTGATVGMPVS